MARAYFCECGRKFSTSQGLNQHLKSSGHVKEKARVIEETTGEVFQLMRGQGGRMPPKPEAPEKTPEHTAGTATDKEPPKYLMIGTLRMPLEDWGYSSTYNLLLVAQTYQDVKRDFGFDGKVGDFCAAMARLVRIIAGYDEIGGVYERERIGSSSATEGTKAGRLEGGE